MTYPQGIGTDGFRQASDALAALQVTSIRDTAFKLLDISLVRLAPAARLPGHPLRYATLGFSQLQESGLDAIYLRHKVESLEHAPAANDDGPAASAPPLAPDGQSSNRLCVSVFGETSVRALLEQARTAAFRPCLVHIADTGNAPSWAALRGELVARRYQVAGALDGAELLIDSLVFGSEEVAPKPSIATFDVFDTLIARRCIEPWRIFEMVGEIAGIADFLDQRRAAEGRVLGRNYNSDDIYDELARYYAWTAEQRQEIQALELSCELSNVIPITENLSRVRDGDLLISDMYLSEASIRSLLRGAGCGAEVGLLVESHGKSSGRVWPTVTAAFDVRRHLGDNPQADVAMPVQFGIESELTKASEPTMVEQTLIDVGLRNLGLLCREARLRTWHADPSIRTLQLIQCSLNLPLLVLASVVLARRAKALGCTTLLFSSRDCNLWMPLFQQLQKKMETRFETQYFLTSRIARKKGSDAYLAYARQHLRPDALVVDLCGTGWTMANLAETLKLKGCNVFLIDHCPPLDLYERARRTPDTCRVHPMFATRPNANNVVLELANMAEHGMLLDMSAVRGALVPRFADEGLSAAETEAVRAQRQAFSTAIDLIKSYDLSAAFALDDADISVLCTSLYEYMSRQAGAYDRFAKTFLQENEAIVRSLIS